ncbi:MAG: FMN-binding protein [Lachnospiraceae bacterium]|nr:FMN-binding protein [Lachnospiraceae bacterium]
MNRYFIKIINLLLILGAIYIYNNTLENRVKAEEIARLSAELESANNQLDEYEKFFDVEKTDGNIVESDYVDGKYEGSAKGYGGDITVEVTIKNGSMTDLRIVSAPNEDGAYLKMASSIVKDILKEQSSSVDTVSGATYSSTGIRDATKNALENAKKNKE